MKNYKIKILMCAIVAWHFNGCSDKNNISKTLETNTVSDFEQRILSRVNSFNSNYVGIKLAPRPEGVELKTNGVAKIKDKSNSKQVTLFPKIGTSKIKIRGEVFLLKNRIETTVLPLVPVFLIKKQRLDMVVQSHQAIIKRNYDAACEQIRLGVESENGFTNSLKLALSCAREYNESWTNFVEDLSKTEFRENESRIEYRWRIAKGSKYYTDKNRRDAFKLKQESQNLLVLYERLKTAESQFKEESDKINSIWTDFIGQRWKLHDDLVQRLISSSEVSSDTGADGKYEIYLNHANSEVFCVCALIDNGIGNKVVISRDVERHNMSEDSVVIVNLSGVHQILPDAKSWGVQVNNLTKQIWDAASRIGNYNRNSISDKPEEFDVLFDE